MSDKMLECKIFYMNDLYNRYVEEEMSLENFYSLIHPKILDCFKDVANFIFENSETRVIRVWYKWDVRVSFGENNEYKYDITKNGISGKSLFVTVKNLEDFKANHRVYGNKSFIKLKNENEELKNYIKKLELHISLTQGDIYLETLKHFNIMQKSNNFI